MDLILKAKAVVFILYCMRIIVQKAKLLTLQLPIITLLLQVAVLPGEPILKVIIMLQ